MSYQSVSLCLRVQEQSCLCRTHLFLGIILPNNLKLSQTIASERRATAKASLLDYDQNFKG